MDSIRRSASLSPDIALPSLLYVEDDQDIAQMTIEVLSESYAVEHADDLARGLELALRRHHDVIVVDRRLPGGDGAQIVSALRTARITTPVLMLTALGTVADRVEGLDGGANDYLVKPFDYDELLARLRALVRGFRAEGRRREIGDWTFIEESSVVYSPTGARVSLTPTETRLLALLAQSPDHVFSREEILGAVMDAGESAGAVDTYVHYLRRKTSSEMVETIRGRGYRVGTP
jgi:two-component system response regulator QseB